MSCATTGLKHHTYLCFLSGDVIYIPHCHLLLVSRLIALEKPQGGVRPIAIGEAFLRLSSICALSTAQNAADLLAPLQIGVGISGLGGAEIPGHSLRLDFCNPDIVTVQVDLQNTFNLANRDDMVHAVADKMPSLLPYVLMAYQQRSPLVIQRADGTHEVLWSEAGVRQGDPMGLLLFALMYQPTLHAAHHEPPCMQRTRSSPHAMMTHTYRDRRTLSSPAHGAS